MAVDNIVVVEVGEGAEEANAEALAAILQGTELRSKAGRLSHFFWVSVCIIEVSSCSSLLLLVPFHAKPSLLLLLRTQKLNWGSLASSSSSSRSLLPNEEELNERKIAEVISKGLISASSSSFDLSVASSVGFQFYLVSFPFLSPLCSH